MTTTLKDLVREVLELEAEFRSKFDALTNDEREELNKLRREKYGPSDEELTWLLGMPRDGTKEGA